MTDSEQQSEVDTDDSAFRAARLDEIFENEFPRWAELMRRLEEN